MNSRAGRHRGPSQPRVELDVGRDVDVVQGEAKRVESIHRRMSSEMKRFETLDGLEAKRASSTNRLTQEIPDSGRIVAPVRSAAEDSAEKIEPQNDPHSTTDEECHRSRRSSSPSPLEAYQPSPRTPLSPPSTRKVLFAMDAGNQNGELIAQVTSSSRKGCSSGAQADLTDEEDDDGMVRIPTPDAAQMPSLRLAGSSLDEDSSSLAAAPLFSGMYSIPSPIEQDDNEGSDELAQENAAKWAELSAQDRKCVQLAALWLEDAVSGTRRKHAHGTLWMERLHESMLLALVRIIIYVGILIPGLTENVYHCTPSLGDPQICRIGSHDTGSPQLVTTQGHVLAIILSLAIAAELWFQLAHKRATAPKTKRRPQTARKWVTSRLIILSLVMIHLEILLSVVLVAADISGTAALNQRRNLHCSVLVLRGFLATYEWLRRNPTLTKRLAYSAREMVAMTLIFLWTLVSFTLLACIIFNPTVVGDGNLIIGFDQPQAPGEQVQFLNVMWKVLAIGTVKNFTSIMLNAYSQNFFFVFYFLTVIVVFVFLAAFMFAVVLARYGSRRVQDRQEEVYSQREALVFTFYYLLKVAGTSHTPPRSPPPELEASTGTVMDREAGLSSPAESPTLFIGSHERSKSVTVTLDALRIPKSLQQSRPKPNSPGNAQDINSSGMTLGPNQFDSDQQQVPSHPRHFPDFSVDSFALLRLASPPQRANSVTGSPVTLKDRLSRKAKQLSQRRNAGTIGIEELRLLLAEYSLIQTQSLTFKALQWRLGRLLGYNGAWVKLAPELMNILSCPEAPDRLSEGEFLGLAEVMRLNERAVLQHYSRTKSLQAWARRRAGYSPLLESVWRKAAKVHSHPGMRLISNIALVINAVVLVGLYQVSPGHDSLGHAWQYVALFLSLAELVIAVLAWGFLGFLLTFPIDWLLLMTSLVTRVAFLLNWQLRNVVESRFLIPSVIRFATLPFQLAPGKLIFAVLVGVGRDILEITAAMCAFGYMYASIGYWAFGGELFVENTSLANSQYASLGFFPHSFNSLPRGLIVLFQFTFLNDWPATMSGLVAVSSNAAPLYFLVWFLVVVAIAMNVLTSAVTRPYIILRADRPKLSLACTRFGLGEEVVKTFLWKEADLIDKSSEVWNKRLDSVENAKTFLQDMNDDPAIAFAAQKIWTVCSKPKDMMTPGGARSVVTASTQLTPGLARPSAV